MTPDLISVMVKGTDCGIRVRMPEGTPLEAFGPFCRRLALLNRVLGRTVWIWAWAHGTDECGPAIAYAVTDPNSTAIESWTASGSLLGLYFPTGGMCATAH